MGRWFRPDSFALEIMPAKSSAQRRWAFGVKGKKWARKHHFDTKGPLPTRVKKKIHSHK